MFKTLVKFNGLNRKQIAVDRLQVVYLTTVDHDEKEATNIHLSNGQWVTAAHSVNEVMALLTSEDQQDSKEQLERWKLQAELKRKAKLEAEELIKKSDINSDEWKIISHHTETTGNIKNIRMILEKIDSEENA